MAERTPIQSLADQYPSSDSDASVLLPGDLDDGPSGDDADQAAVDVAFGSIIHDHAADEAADDEELIRARLADMGISGAAAISLIAPTDSGLVAVAAEILGADYSDASLAALLRVWGSSLHAGRTEIKQRARTLMPHRLLSPPPPAPPPEVTPAAVSEPVRRTSAEGTPVPALHRVAAATLTAATHVYLASTTETRDRPVPTPLPPGSLGFRVTEISIWSGKRSCECAAND